MRQIDTKDRLLEAAERLFASGGLSRTSLRAITCEAGVNVAAVHYHFGSKDELLVELVRRRIAPMNEERLARLEEIESRHSEGALPLDPVLRAFIEPAFRFRTEMSGQEQLGRFFGRLYSEPEEILESTLREIFEDIAKRFRAAFARAVPGLPDSELDWRFHFLIGVVVHTLMGRREMDTPNDGTAPDHEVIDRVVAFTAAGLSAPVEIGQ
ncbi:MAG: TetR/AcrR family transcriptional regulator [Candidatus Binatia bacterium]|nr:TetR/AcrR family transcriptional regulator [Candidatus Binatia bacterium]